MRRRYDIRLLPPNLKEGYNIKLMCYNPYLSIGGTMGNYECVQTLTFPTETMAKDMYNDLQKMCALKLFVDLEGKRMNYYVSGVNKT